jgi:excisionase family DNA binding protein
MEKKFLNIDELSQYLGIKKSNLYSKVERREIPFYRLGRLIMFKKDEVDAFMETCRVESVDPGKEAKRILKGKTRPGIDIKKLVKKAIDGPNEREYTPTHRETRPIRDLRKEVSDGSL